MRTALFGGFVVILVWCSPASWAKTSGQDLRSGAQLHKSLDRTFPPLFPPKIDQSVNTAHSERKGFNSQLFALSLLYHFAIQDSFATSEDLAWEAYKNAMTAWARQSGMGVNASRLIYLIGKRGNYEEILNSYSALVREIDPSHPLLESVEAYRKHLGSANSIQHYGKLVGAYWGHLKGDEYRGSKGYLQQLALKCASPNPRRDDIWSDYVGFGTEYPREVATSEADPRDVIRTANQLQALVQHGTTPFFLGSCVQESEPATTQEYRLLAEKLYSDLQPEIKGRIVGLKDYSGDEADLGLVGQAEPLRKHQHYLIPRTDGKKSEAIFERSTAKYHLFWIKLRDGSEGWKFIDKDDPIYSIPRASGNRPQVPTHVQAADLHKVPAEQVNLTQCPRNPVSHQGKQYSDSDFVTIGDLHGNFAKLIFFLVKEGIATFQNGTDCQTLLDFYYNPNNTIPDPALDVPVRDDIKRIIASMQIAKPPHAPHVRFMGDEYGDRGKNDALTTEVFKRLHQVGSNFEVMMSNHTINFLREISGVGDDLVSQGQSRSTKPITQIKRSDPKAFQEIKDFIRSTYLKHVKLVSVTPQGDGKPVVFTHAPSDPKRVYLAAVELDADIPNCDTVQNIEKNIIHCAGVINQIYVGRMRAAMDSPPADATEKTKQQKQRSVLNRRLSVSADLEEFSVERDHLADLFWMRHNDPGFEDRNNGTWKTANGHDKGMGSHFELDNDLGKGDGAYTGGYVVLRPVR